MTDANPAMTSLIPTSESGSIDVPVPLSDAPPPPPPDAKKPRVVRDEDFYLDGGDTVIEADSVLFKVIFLNYSSLLSHIAQFTMSDTSRSSHAARTICIP